RQQVRQLDRVLVRGGGVELVGPLGLLPALVHHTGHVVALGVVGGVLSRQFQLALGSLELALLDRDLGGQDPQVRVGRVHLQGVVGGLAALVEIGVLVLVAGQAVQHAGPGVVPAGGGGLLALLLLGGLAAAGQGDCERRRNDAPEIPLLHGGDSFELLGTGKMPVNTLRNCKDASGLGTPYLPGVGPSITATGSP